MRHVSKFSEVVLFLKVTRFLSVSAKKMSNLAQNSLISSLRKQPSFFAPGPSGVSRNATRAGSEQGRLFSQAT